MGQQSNEDQSGGGNVVGRAPRAALYQPPAFMGKSGQPDNQDTSKQQVGSPSGSKS